MVFLLSASGCGGLVKAETQEETPEKQEYGQKVRETSTVDVKHRSLDFKHRHNRFAKQSAGGLLPVVTLSGLVPQALSGYGLQYKHFYLGAQVEALTHFRSSLGKEHKVNMREGMALVSGGIRFGSFLNHKTLVYVKAGFNRPLTHEFYKGPTIAERLSVAKTVFMPGVGLEWHLPEKLSLSAEIRASFGRHVSPIKTSKRQQGSILFNIHYQFGKVK
jgi:hypothetical protein